MGRRAWKRHQAISNRKWGCERKRWYPNQIDADIAARFHNRIFGGSTQRSYHCPFCRGWHLTKQPTRHHRSRKKRTRPSMYVYLSSSWKNRVEVRQMAEFLRARGHKVYDFTDPKCRNTPEIPPERFPTLFDPKVHRYETYLRGVPEWKEAVDCNQAAIEQCDAVVLMLPCGNDAHADAYYGLGLGKKLLVYGHPNAGDRTPTHLWADAMLDTPDGVAARLNVLSREKNEAEAKERKDLTQWDSTHGCPMCATEGPYGNKPVDPTCRHCHGLGDSCELTD